MWIVLLSNNGEVVGINHFNDSRAFIKYLNDINCTDENIEEYNLNKESKVLILFDDMVVDMSSSKKLQ